MKVDITMIMEKQRKPLESLEVVLEGERGKEGARPFEKINMKFLAKGKDIDLAQLQRAADLSTEKYCGVHATLSGIAKITHTVEIVQ